MSMDTWKEEFYPVPAREVPEAEAIDHCIRKWEGLRPEAMERHGIRRNTRGRIIRDRTKENGLYIDDESCALCHHHDHNCVTCPLYMVRGISCDQRSFHDRDGESNPFIEWVDNSNPEPMIFWLKKAKELEETMLDVMSFMLEFADVVRGEHPDWRGDHNRNGEIFMQTIRDHMPDFAPLMVEEIRDNMDEYSIQTELPTHILEQACHILEQPTEGQNQ